MNTFKLKVGTYKEYESILGEHATNTASSLAHNDRRYEYRKELEWFTERTFKSKEELLSYKKNMYGDDPDFVFMIYRLNMLGDWHHETWFE